MERSIVDNDPLERFPLYTRANVGEVFPDPVSPFTRSAFLYHGAELGWRDAWVRLGAFELDEFTAEDLEPGDVLIAPITDPSWTPLFVPACAVVVDVGAPLSHAVIVSRELGIPCVVSATGATKAIPDGALVRVDGSTGLVTIL